MSAATATERCPMCSADAVYVSGSDAVFGDWDYVRCGDLCGWGQAR